MPSTDTSVGTVGKEELACLMRHLTNHKFMMCTKIPVLLLIHCHQIIAKSFLTAAVLTAAASAEAWVLEVASVLGQPDVLAVTAHRSR